MSTSVWQCQAGMRTWTYAKFSVKYFVFFDFAAISVIKLLSMMDDYPIKELKCRYTAQVLGFFTIFGQKITFW